MDADFQSVAKNLPLYLKQTNKNIHDSGINKSDSFPKK
jgi:hypothetical protein